MLYVTSHSSYFLFFFFFIATATTKIYTLSLHDALPIFLAGRHRRPEGAHVDRVQEQRQPLGHLAGLVLGHFEVRSEEHTSELQSRPHLVCRLLLEKKNTNNGFGYTLVILDVPVTLD